MGDNLLEDLPNFPMHHFLVGKRKKYQIKIITKKWNEETASQTRFEERKCNVRTFFHDPHFADIPGGEITVEFIGINEHCTHRHTTKVEMRKMGRKTNI